MVVTCTSCKAKFKIADEKVTAAGVKVRCSKCKTIFSVQKPAAGAAEAPEAAPPPPAPRQDYEDAPTRSVPVPDELRYEAGGSPAAAGSNAGDIDLDAPAPRPSRAGPAKVALPAPATPTAAARGDDDDPFANIDIEVPTEAPKPKIPAGMKLAAKAAPPPAPKTAPDLAAATRAAQAQALPTPPPKPPPKAQTSARSSGGGMDDFGNIEFGGDDDGGATAQAAPSVSPSAAASMLDDTPPGLMDSAGHTPSYASEPVPDLSHDPLADSGNAAPPAGEELGAPVDGGGADPFAAGRDAFGTGADDLGDLGGPTAALPEVEAEPKANIPAGAVVLGRVRKEEDAAPVDLPPPPPVPALRRVLAHLVNLVALVAVLAVGAVTYAAYRSGGRLELLSLDAIAAAIRGQTTASLRVSEAHSGIYDTAGGPLLYLMGTVENLTGAAAARVKVTAEIQERGGRTVKWAAGLAGAVPTPEELYALNGAEDLARLNTALEARAAQVPIGARERFFVAFYDHPPELDQMSMNFVTEVLARALSQPAPPPPPPPAPEPAPLPAPVPTAKGG